MKALLASMIALGMLAAACDNSSSDEMLTLPSAPPDHTDTFTGTLDPGGVHDHTFTVSRTGEVDITLTSVAGAGVPSTVFVGLFVGVPSGDTCTLIQGFGGAVQANSTMPQISGSAQAGQFCVEIKDIGNLAGTVDYSITVAHP
jgi:hypothetical protein